MMNASKENGRKALEVAQMIQRCGSTKSVDNEFLVAFVEAAIRKLPSEKAYKADKQRRRKAKA